MRARDDGDDRAAPGLEASGRIPGLDGLRAIAILAVIALHVVGQTSFPIGQYPLLEPFARFGWAGVDLFFAISGFLITTLMVREERAAPSRSFHLGHFYARRALRILPAYYAALALGFFVWGNIPSIASCASLSQILALAPAAPWLLASFTSNYAVVLGLLPVSIGGAYVVMWSLCIEEHFYLFWSVFMRFVHTPRVRVVVGVALCGTSIVLRALTAASWTQQVAWLKMLTHLRFDAILVGAVAALAFEALRRRPRLVRFSGITACAVVLAFLVTGNLYERDLGIWGFTVGYSALALACTWIVVEVALHPGCRGVRLLDARPLTWVGRVSFAAYLVNVPVIDLSFQLIAERFPPGDAPLLHLLVVGPLIVGAVLTTAWVLHVTVERPAMRQRRRFGPEQAPNVTPKEAQTG